MNIKVFILLTFFLITNFSAQKMNDNPENEKSDNYKNSLKTKNERMMPDGNLTYLLVFNDGTTVPYGELIYNSRRDGVNRQNIETQSQSVKSGQFNFVKESKPWALLRCEGRFNVVNFDNEVDAFNAAYSKFKIGKCL